VTSVLAPLGSPYIGVTAHNGVLLPNESAVVKLQFSDPSAAAIDYNARVLSVVPAP